MIYNNNKSHFSNNIIIKCPLPEKSNHTLPGTRLQTNYGCDRKQSILRRLMKNHPLPEKCISPCFRVIKVASWSGTKNLKHVALQLGLPFIGEMYSRLIHSQKKHNGTYYCYAEQLINNAKAVCIFKCVNFILGNLSDNIDLHQLICKNICDYLTWPKERLNDFGLIILIDRAILLAMQHPIISDCYRVQEIQTINLCKSKNINHFSGLINLYI